MRPIESSGAAQNVAIGIGLDAAVQKLVPASEGIEQARPTPANPEHHRVAPHHHQFPGLVAGVAFQSKLVDFKNNGSLAIDQDKVRPQCSGRLVEAEPLDRRIFRDQVHGFGRSGRINAHHAGSLSIRKSSIARVWI